MGDSDDEYDRKRRDKFRGERAEPAYRGTERPVRTRDEWPERDAWSRPRPRDYGGRVRDRGYSPSFEPTTKRMRNDYYGDSYYNHYPTYHQQAHRETPAVVTEGQQPPMMSFKAFLATQDDNISDSEAIEKYNDYKLEFQRQQLNEFFVSHKDDEWFRLKYHPEDSVKRKDEQMSALKKRVEVFLDLLNTAKLSEVSVDCSKTDEMIKLLDTVVIKLEGGDEDDISVLEQEYAEKCLEIEKKKRKEEETQKEVEVPEKKPDDVPETKTTQEEDGEVGAEKPKPVEEEKIVEAKTNGSEEQEEGAVKEDGEEDEEEGESVEKEKMEVENEAEIIEEKKEEEEVPPPVVEEKTEDEMIVAAAPEEPEEPASKKEEEIKEEPVEETEKKEEIKEEPEVKPKKAEKEKKQRKRSYSGSSSSSSSSSSSDSDEEKEEKKDKEKEVEEKPEKEEEPKEAVEEKPEKPKSLHKTTSIFLRNLAPTITRQEVEAMCGRYDGFMRVALADPQPERRWLRRGWVTFKRDANIKEICWNLNNIRLRDCELGAIVNRDLSRRIRPVNGITAHKQVVRSDIRISAKVTLHLDNKVGLWPDDDEKKDKPQQTFGLVSNNPVLHNITDYLIEEASAEEEELLGLEPTSDSQDSTTNVERDDSLISVLDRIILYLRIVHSVDYYNHCEYPNEDEMPNRCGILHARGPPPTAKTDITQFIGAPIEGKMSNFLPEKPPKEESLKNESKLVNLSLKDVDMEIDKFVQANTRELAKDKWLCPLSGKKFKGPDFVRKHIFNKHGEKIEEVKKEVEFFNNYLKDPKRPMLAEAPQPKREETPTYSHPPSYGGSYGGGGYGGYGAPSRYNQFAQRPRGYAARSRGGGGGGADYRPVVHYRDLDAPREPEEFI